MSLRKAFSIVLKQERLKRSLSQEKLADLCNLDRTYISLLEREQRNPTLEVVHRISLCFDMKPSEFLKKMEMLMEF